MQERDWKILIGVGLGALAFLIVVGSLFSGWNHGGAWGMMRPEMAGEWHRGNIGAHMGGGWGFGPFGLFFGLIGLMFRLGFFVLLIVGGLWLFSRLRGSQEFSSMFSSMSSAGPSRTTQTCANCGRPVQSNWQHCPHCGQPIARANNEGNGPEDTPPTETVHA